MLLGFLSTGFSQTVSIINKKFVVNGNASCPIYFNGANTPWNNWNDFGGNYNATFWSTHFATLKANGINASRVWISCNGDVQPNINTDGTVTGVSTQFWTNLDNFFQSAQANGIYIMATMMSFDHTKNTYQKYQSWRNMLNDQTKVQSYCDNYLVPFVNRYKSNPYLMSIDISNEIEWVAEDVNNMRCSYAVLQRFVAMCASAIHNNPRTDGSTVLVTMGSAATKWNATKMRAGENGAWSQNNGDGNKWSDAALKAQYNQANAILDYYSPHYYSWVDAWYSNPYVRTPADFGMDDKAVLIGETPAGNPGTPNLAVLASYNALKNNGYQGHFPWTSNGVDALGDISKFGADAKTFATNNSALVYPTCSVVCATVAPTVTTPVTYCRNATAVALTATGTGLKWYADNTTTTALTAAPIPSTSTVGTVNYYVSQTLNNCEGPRALIAVTVNALPTATITTAVGTQPVTICADNSVILTSSTGTSYKWSNAAGIIAGATSATYTTNIADSYTVTVTGTNNCSATSTATVIVVNALPVAAITTTSPTTFCTGGNVTLTSSTGILYQWNNSAGAIAGATSATYIATTAGSYSVAVTNSNKCSATSAPKVVIVNTLPTATVTANGATTFCQGGNVSLTTSGGTLYQWNNAAGPIAGATNSTYAAITTGSYTVKVTNANNCFAISAATAVTVNALPVVTISTTTPTTICAGGSVLLTASAGFAYKWFRGTTQVGTGQTYLATVAGSYTVEATNSSTCTATSAATIVTINAVPLPVITTTTPTTFCEGGSVLMTSSPGSSYKWFRGTTTQVGIGQTYSATVSGNYTVEVTNANNCVMTSQARSVIVNPLPTAAISTITPTAFCTGGSVLLTASAGSSYKWFRGTTTQVGIGQTYSATVSGNYTVEVTNANNCTALSAVTTVTVTSGLTWYQDSDEDGKGDAAVTQTACTQPAGYVSISGDACPTDVNKLLPGLCGCGIQEGTCQTTGVVDLKSTEAIKIMPNPSSDQFNLILAESALVHIYTVEGKLVEIFPNTTEVKFGSDYAKGVYVIQIMNGSTTQVIRVIKQ